MSNNRVVWFGPDDPVDVFPPVESALREPDGLLAAGGDLSKDRLLCAYSRGIFPWYNDGQPLLWWSPDPRCVFKPGDFHLSRRARRSLRRSNAELRFNTSFGHVIRACAAPRDLQQGTWITSDMIAAYEDLHSDGWAHCVEIWQDGSLVGGLYGIAIGHAFFGESMFSKAANASKMALLMLSKMMESGDFGIVDCQVPSSHLLSQGATLIPRPAFIEILKQLCEPAIRFENWPSAPISVHELLSG